MISLATVDSATFAPVVGEAFRVAAPGAAITLELAEVSVLGGRRAEAARDPFALEFRGPSGLRLPQGMYHFDHAALGAMEIFITQIGDGIEGSRFEAIFS